MHLDTLLQSAQQQLPGQLVCLAGPTSLHAVFMTATQQLAACPAQCTVGSRQGSNLWGLRRSQAAWLALLAS